MSLRTVACVFAVVLVVPAAPAADPYAIRLRGPDVNETMRVEKEETRTIRIAAYDGLGQMVMDRRDKEVETTVYRETVLEKSAGVPTVLRRRYEKAQLKKGRGTPRNLPLHGLTVRIAREGDLYRFTYDGRPAALPAADAEPLDREFNGRDEKFRLASLLPNKPVPVGAEWPLEMGPVVKDFLRTGRFAAEPSLATGSGRLTETSPMGNDQFGLITLKMEIPIREMTVDGPKRSPALPGSKATFELTLDLCIDGARPDTTVLGTSEVSASALVPQPSGQPGRVTFSHKSDSHEVRKPVADK